MRLRSAEQVEPRPALPAPPIRRRRATSALISTAVRTPHRLFERHHAAREQRVQNALGEQQRGLTVRVRYRPISGDGSNVVAFLSGCHWNSPSARRREREAVSQPKAPGRFAMPTDFVSVEGSGAGRHNPDRPRMIIQVRAALRHARRQSARDGSQHRPRAAAEVCTVTREPDGGAERRDPRIAQTFRGGPQLVDEGVLRRMDRAAGRRDSRAADRAPDLRALPADAQYRPDRATHALQRCRSPRSSSPTRSDARLRSTSTGSCASCARTESWMHGGELVPSRRANRLANASPASTTITSHRRLRPRRLTAAVPAGGLPFARPLPYRAASLAARAGGLAAHVPPPPDLRRQGQDPLRGPRARHADPVFQGRRDRVQRPEEGHDLRQGRAQQPHLRAYLHPARHDRHPDPFHPPPQHARAADPPGRDRPDRGGGAQRRRRHALDSGSASRRAPSCRARSSNIITRTTRSATR